MGNKYSSGERYLAKFLSKFPQLKVGLKKAYQKLNLLLYKKNYAFKSLRPLHVVPGEHESFFGYYDKSPLSIDDSYLLYYESDHSTQNKPDSSKTINVNVFDVKENKIIYTAKTNSYNWQQGARAQWLTAHSFIYNQYDAKSNNYYSVIVDLNNSASTIINSPVYDCYKDDYALTLNFSRLMALRPDYGYRNRKISTDNDITDLQQDGIFKVDLHTGNVNLLISLQLLKETHPQPKMENALHKVNHLMISPDGENFIFLHRYYLNGQRFDRLFKCGKNGENMKLLADDEMISHYCWEDNENIIVYLRDKALGDKYYKVNILTAAKEIVGEGIIDSYGDGHPTVHKNKMVFDTYPNKARMKELFLFDLQSKNLEKLGEFYESLAYYGESRCDLHPRFTYDGKKVFFDSVHSGKRSLYWIEI